MQWLELQGLKFTSVPNSTFTKSWKQKSANTAQGLRAGFPDLIVLIPPARAKDGISRLLAPEMKRIKGGVVSPQQREWIAALNALGSVNIDSVVAHGSEEAIEYISSFLKDVSTSPF
ncbi:VRR-NUC domain-containing protein [Cryobacterium algoricola]|uniref:VRR-NUC domain-containing protein n=1 Tax=Cryobacterium algoricola TaxID=1259183 RepID=UPI00141B95DC|nr:VRR-NUC domain-containing protein [Cryobacterium algoricola]